MGSKYYGVIGNRDHIKIKGEKRPFWDFLDKQPDGYLTSLVYMRQDLPNLPMIFDCGAWSYRNEEAPKITPETALVGYMKLAKPGDILIAPDHMLIDGADLDARRQFNKESAKRFFDICPSGFKPMATLHGMDIEERINHGRELASAGYRHIAIGGVAARASQKKLVLSMVQEIRDSLPDVWLHVLGLSSPLFAAAWHKMGVDSFDGSSHFKQAFTGGAFFMIENGKMKKYQAARADEEISAPICNCTACACLREEGVDTRMYGSNEHNMGRAAHNMNILMQAQEITINGTTVLVSCVGKKLDHPAPAKNLYQSDWFHKARRWAEQNGDRWFILSTKHGLISPEKIIKPYECTLNEMSAEKRKAWGEKVLAEIRKHVPCGKIIILAGSKYREFLDVPTHSVEIPMQGLGIGQQLSWLNSQNISQLELFS